MVNHKTLQGKVTVTKRLLDHPVWRREPASYGQAWIWLLLLANDREGTTTVHGQPLRLRRGQVGWSRQGLEKEWQRSQEWVTAFLKFCRDETMITVESTRRGTVITILNYDTYNPPHQVTDPATDSVSEPVSDSLSGPVSEPVSDPLQNREPGTMEGGTVKEDEAARALSAAPGESVSDAGVFAFAHTWPGEMVSGTPVMAPDWVNAFLLRLNGRREWPRDWRRFMVAAWRSEWRSHVPGSGAGGGKNAPEVSANVAAIENQKKAAALSREDDALAYELNALAQQGRERPADKLARWNEVRRQLREMTDL